MFFELRMNSTNSAIKKIGQILPRIGICENVAGASRSEQEMREARDALATIVILMRGSVVIRESFQRKWSIIRTLAEPTLFSVAQSSSPA